MYDIERLKNEVDTQIRYFNFTVAPLVLSFTYAALSLNQPQTALLLALPLIAAMIASGLHLKPKVISELEKKEKNLNNHPHIQETIKELEYKFRGWNAVLCLWPLFFSHSIYLISMMCPNFLNFLHQYLQLIFL